MEKKKCTKCGEYKTLDNFCVKSKAKDGLNPWCKECSSKINREYRERLKKYKDVFEEVENLEGEIWKDIREYEGLYQVSNLGRVKSLKKEVIRGNHVLPKIYPESLLKPSDNRGYLQVKLCKDKKRKAYSVHRLVAIAFIPNPNNYPMVNHKDENPSNNKLENLEWCTNEYNLNYGTRNKRIASKNSIPVFQYDLNGNLINKWESLKSTRKGRFTPSLIKKCCNGEIKEYNGYVWRYKYENK